MKHLPHRSTTARGFTLLELLISSGILTLILASLIPLAMSIYRDYIIGQTLSQFEIESSTTREWLKRDLACTSANEFQLHPTGNTTQLLAVGFPILSRTDTPSDLPIDADGNVEWTHTVIYHLFTADDGDTELRRTVFSPRASLTPAERQIQLEDVHQDGNGANTYNSGSATTQTLLSKVISHNITSGTGEIDTYAAHRTNQVFSFGTWVLSPGYHTYTFEITGSNPASSGHSFALDRINVSATGEAIDAECLLPVQAESGATAAAQDMSEFSGWSNNSQLNFPGASPGNYMKLKIYNDCWIESTFSDDDATIEETEVSFDSSIAEIVCQLRGLIPTWEAVTQTHTAIPVDPEIGVDYSGYDVRVIISGADLTLGENIAYGRPRSYVTFRAASNTASYYCHIKAAYIMEQDTGYNGVAGTEVPLEFPSGWNIDYEREIYAYGMDNGSAPDSMWVVNGYTGVSTWNDFPIDPTKNYIVSFHLGYVSKTWDSTKEEYVYEYYYPDPSVWPDTDGNTNSYAYHNPAPATSMAGTADWSSLDSTLIEEKDRVLAVQNITVSYPQTGTYTSKILDTRIDSPEYVALNWRENVVGTDDITIKVRTGDAEDLSDALGWSAATKLTTPDGSNSISTLSGRYVQWQATLSSAAPYTTTPKLRDVTLRWKGQERGVQITVNADQAPNRGKLTLAVDGEEPQPSQLRMEFKLGQEIADKQYTKDISVGVTPKN